MSGLVADEVRFPGYQTEKLTSGQCLHPQFINFAVNTTRRKWSQSVLEQPQRPTKRVEYQKEKIW